MCQGYGCRVLAFDVREDPQVRELGVEYVSKESLLQEADVVSLHCPLLPTTYHIIDKARQARGSQPLFVPWCQRTFQAELPQHPQSRYSLSQLGY